MRPDDPLDAAAHDFLERLARPLRAPVQLSDAVERRVLAQLRGEPARRPGLARVFAPAAALAAGLILTFGLGVLVGRRSSAPSVGAGTIAAAAGLRTVEFALRMPADSAVVLVGDFNDWDPRATPLRHEPGDVWTVTVPLRPGRYRYTFIVDGTRWHRDPSAPPARDDDFGAPTSVITVAQR